MSVELLPTAEAERIQYFPACDVIAEHFVGAFYVPVIVVSTQTITLCIVFLVAVVVVVVVVVGQTVGSISSKMLAYDYLSAHLNCARHR